jgi:hypothetical protein
MRGGARGAVDAYTPTGETLATAFSQPNSKALATHVTTRKTVIGCTLSAVVHLEPLSDNISTAVQYLESLLISVQLIEHLSAAVLVLNRF